MQSLQQPLTINFFGASAMKVSIAQIAPVFLDSSATWNKLKEYLYQAAEIGSELITWGETLIPGYPQWLSSSGGARFNDDDQKTAYATYWREALTLDDRIVLEMKQLAKDKKIMLMGGIAEKQGGSVYCTLLTIGSNGEILGRHRKLKPTYEERLVWADGDGLGLRVYQTSAGPVGGLNCWENWLPLARAALHRKGEFLHLAVWPISIGLTKEISRFMALEGRSWIFSASGLLRPQDFHHLNLSDFPMRDIMTRSPRNWQNGGSMIVDPTGNVIAGPLVDAEGILTAKVDPMLVVKERQNLDYSGHYSRFDVFDFEIRQESQLHVP